MSEYRLRPAARDDLDEIWRWTWKTWSENQADAYIDSLTDAMAALARDPAIGRAADELRNGVMRTICRSHVIFYQKASGGIDVIRILHVRMDYAAHLKDDV